MKNESTYAKPLAALLKKVRTKYAADAPEVLNPVTQMIVAFLEWNATTEQALRAHEKLMAEMVDNNDVRVSLPHEIVAVIGPRYPMAQERAMRMRESLNEVFNREHGTMLDALEGKAKKQIRSYLDTLPGIPPYVAAQVLLLCYGGHAVPVDDVMLELLRAENVVEPDADAADVCGFLERQVKAAEALETHAAMRAWADAEGGKATSKTTKKSTTKKKTTKKTTAKKSPTKKTTKKKTTKK